MRLERTVLRTVVVALTLLLVGVLMLVYAESEADGWTHVLPLQVGSFIIASVVLALIFEYWQLRGLLEDLYIQAGITREIRAAGIVGFTTIFHAKVDWDDLIAAQLPPTV